MLKNVLAAALALLLVAAAPVEAANRAIARGDKGQVLTASASRNLNPNGQWVSISGNHYDETVGIYVTYCVVVPKGELPSPCGAGIDVTGKTHTSVWVSSNPPFFAKPVVTPYGVGGTFKVRVRINKMAGDFDCTKVKCAITTRSDHLNTDNRTNDVFIPITFASK